MAGEATVEESAMLESRAGGEREVDVAISSEVAGHKVTVSVEATASRRPATVEWVERMVKKHESLPTSKLVLVSESGFTSTARTFAEQQGVVTLEPKDIEGPDRSYVIVNRLKAIWPKLVELTPESAKVWVKKPNGQTVWFKAPADLDILLEDGSELPAPLYQLVRSIVEGRWDKIIEDIGLRDITEDRDEFFVLFVEPVNPRIDGIEVSLFARYQDETGSELHSIERIEVSGRAVITVRQVDLSHASLGDIEFAHGNTTFPKGPALVVATEDKQGGKLTLRLHEESDDRTLPSRPAAP